MSRYEHVSYTHFVWSTNMAMIWFMGEYLFTFLCRGLVNFRSKEFVLLFCSPYKEPPLFNMEFVILGNNLTRSRNEIERMVKKLGGKIAPSIHYKLAAVISNEEELQKMSEQILTAKLYGIQIVSEAFLTEVAELNIDPILYIISQSICDWGGDVSGFYSFSIRHLLAFSLQKLSILAVRSNREKQNDCQCQRGSILYKICAKSSHI